MFVGIEVPQVTVAPELRVVGLLVGGAEGNGLGWAHCRRQRARVWGQHQSMDSGFDLGTSKPWIMVLGP